MAHQVAQRVHRPRFSMDRLVGCLGSGAFRRVFRGHLLDARPAFARL